MVVVVYVCVCTHIHVNMHPMAHMWVPEDYILELALSFHFYMGSRGQTQITGLIGKKSLLTILCGQPNFSAS